MPKGVRSITLSNINQQAKLTRWAQTHNENLKRPSLPRKSKPVFGAGLQAGLKRKAEQDAVQLKSKKRSAFGDITNAIGKSLNVGKKKGAVVLEKQVDNLLPEVLELPCASSLEDNNGSVNQKIDPEQTEKMFKDVFTDFNEESNSSHDSNKENRMPVLKNEDLIVKVPCGVADYDAQFINDPGTAAMYAQDIFNYYKARELVFKTSDYIGCQPDVSRSMRAVLVDWMVEVQESYELNHETLYLSVKIVDRCLDKLKLRREDIQLLGSASLYVACKFDERVPPFVDDFLYICDDAYTKEDLLSMEQTVLKTLKYELGMPLSYRFLRRFARCAKTTMERLTFARYILERSLLEYEFVQEFDSLVAAGSLLLAAKIQGAHNMWDATLRYYSGYEESQLKPIVGRLHQMMLQPPKEHLMTIHSKYSHELFFKVATLKVPSQLSW